MNIARAVRRKISQLSELEARVQYVQEALGRIEARQLAGLQLPRLRDHEFKVYSQWGEDGIIQYLVRRLDIACKTFVEFGVESYVESNTRFLLRNDNWSGLVIDGSESNIDFIRKDNIYWRHDLTAVQSFITRDNINRLISEHGLRGEIGLLSVDIDGNDYWVWEAIDVVDPVIVVVEYNARFGADRAVTVPYDAGFVRAKAHPSMIYYGASLKAFHKLAARKGYALVGCNSAGNNAFFVRRDAMPADFPDLSAEEAFVRNRFRELRDVEGQLLFGSWDEERKILDSLPLVEID